MRIKRSQNDKIFMAINVLFLSLCAIAVLYPLIYIVSASFSSPHAVRSAQVWLWPVDATLDGYKAVFKNDQLVQGFLNSLFYMTVGTAINLVLTVCAAYPLSRKDLAGRNVVMAAFVFTMLFSGGLIPTYIVVKNLNLLDTRWALLLPVALSVWNMIIARTYFQTAIPKELHEAAQLDGCSDLRFLTSVALKLSGPILAVIGLYYAIGHWNSYFTALIYLRNSELFPLQIVLRNILVINQMDMTMLKDFDAMRRKQGLIDIIKYAVIVVSSVPVLLIYPFVQKHFVKGMLIGSLKG